MPSYRMSYSIEGQRERRQVMWTPELGHIDLPSFAAWVMEREFTGQHYGAKYGTEAVLRKHGITDIRSPDLTSGFPKLPEDIKMSD
jgi:hypothetical protein